jgi:Bacterial archaeo-eukaryotic release factor family 2
MRLDSLRPLDDEPGPWASVCTSALPTDGSAAEVRELTARGLSHSLTEQGVDPATMAAVREALSDVVPADAPHGTAVFAAGGRVRLQLPLPCALPAPVVRWTALPHVMPLAEAYAAEVHCLVARIDRTGADFELRDGGDAQPAGGAEGRRHPVHRTATADWSERHFQLRVENTWQQNAGEIAVGLADAAERSHPDLVVLAGDPRERREVFDRLPAPLREHTAISDHGGRAAGASSDLLDADVAAASEDFTHRRDRALLGRLQAGAGEGAAHGVLQLVDAAQQHRIDTLVLCPDSGDLKQEMWVGWDADRVSVRRTADTPIATQAGDALVRAAVATGADVAVLGPEHCGAPGSQGPDGARGAAAGAAGGAASETEAAGKVQQRTVDTGTAGKALPGGMGALLRWK